MMANCELTVDVRAAVWPVRLNQTIAEVIQRNVEIVGMPSWTEQENAFARRLQKQAGVPEIGLRRSVGHARGPAVQIAASNDCGDVSWKVPMGRIWFPGNVPHLPFHHWTAGAPLATSIAHKGGLAGAKALAASVIEFLPGQQPGRRDQVQLRPRTRWHSLQAAASGGSACARASQSCIDGEIPTSRWKRTISLMNPSSRRHEIAGLWRTTE